MSYFLDEYFHPLYEDTPQFESMKKKDSGYNKMYKFDEKLQKQKAFDVYTSPLTNGYIRDAVTGQMYAERVGSAEARHFFKVVLCNGKCTSANGSNVLYYTGPHEYMKHFNTTLDDNILEKWNSKFL